VKHQMPPRQGNQLAHSLNTVPRVNILGVGVTPASTWRSDAAASAAPAHVLRAARFYMAVQVETGHLCPITMTHAARAIPPRFPARSDADLRRRRAKDPAARSKCIIWRWSSNRRPDGTGALVALLSIGASMRSINLRQAWVVPAISSALNTTRTNT